MIWMKSWLICCMKRTFWDAGYNAKGNNNGGLDKRASMRAKLSRVFIQAILRDRPCTGRFRKSSLANLRDVQEEICVQGYLCLWLLRSSWQLREVSRKRPWTSFYPCQSRTGHPMMYSREARKAFEERPHLYFGSQAGDPARATGRSHQPSQHKPRDLDSLWIRRV